MSKRFGIFCLLLLPAAGVQAQTVYPYVTSGTTIVSRDASGGVKSEALLTTAQKTFLMNKSTQPVYNETSEYNRVSAKFQVASTDASTGTTWEDAYAKCKSYSTGAAAGSWRLPTQRELMLIWLFKSQLTGCGTLPTASNYFWSGTESRNDTSTAWFVRFSSGYTYSTDKSDGSRFVRCVRDL